MLASVVSLASVPGNRGNGVGANTDRSLLDMWTVRAAEWLLQGFGKDSEEVEVLQLWVCSEGLGGLGTHNVAQYSAESPCGGKEGYCVGRPPPRRCQMANEENLQVAKGLGV